MKAFYSPLEQFEISSYTAYPTTWSSVFTDLYQYNFFYNTDFLISDNIVSILLIFFIYFFVRMVMSLTKIGNIFLLWFFVISLLTCVYTLVFVDHKLYVYDLENLYYTSGADSIINNMNVHVYYGLEMGEWWFWMSCLLEIGAGLLIILTLNAEQHNLHRMTMYPSINHMVGEMLYKTGFMLLVSTLGKEIESREFFIKVKTIFVFLIITNLQGMIPYTGTITSSLANTFYIALALFISILMTIKEKKGLAYFLNLFMPPGCPINLIFLLIPIEVISYSFRVVSLSVRLFANMMAGHTLLKVIVGFSWVMVFMGDGMLLCNLIPIAVLMILTLLEIGVALIQAYIFSILTCIYIRDIFEGH